MSPSNAVILNRLQSHFIDRIHDPITVHVMTGVRPMFGSTCNHVTFVNNITGLLAVFGFYSSSAIRNKIPVKKKPLWQSIN